MAGIALLDGNAVEHTRAANFVTPDLAHFRHASIGHVLLDGRRAHHRTVARHLVGSRAHRRHAEQDRIVAVIDRLDVDHGTRLCAAGIMTAPFAERALDDLAVGMDIAFDYDLGARPNREG